MAEDEEPEEVAVEVLVPVVVAVPVVAAAVEPVAVCEPVAAGVLVLAYWLARAQYWVTRPE